MAATSRPRSALPASTLLFAPMRLSSPCQREKASHGAASLSIRRLSTSWPAWQRTLKRVSEDQVEVGHSQRADISGVEQKSQTSSLYSVTRSLDSRSSTRCFGEPRQLLASSPPLTIPFFTAPSSFVRTSSTATPRTTRSSPSISTSTKLSSSSRSSFKPTCESGEPIRERGRPFSFVSVPHGLLRSSKRTDKGPLLLQAPSRISSSTRLRRRRPDRRRKALASWLPNATSSDLGCCGQFMSRFASAFLALTLLSREQARLPRLSPSPKSQARRLRGRAVLAGGGVAQANGQVNVGAVEQGGESGGEQVCRKGVGEEGSQVLVKGSARVSLPFYAAS